MVSHSRRRFGATRLSPLFLMLSAVVAPSVAQDSWLPDPDPRFFPPQEGVPADESAPPVLPRRLSPPLPPEALRQGSYQSVQVNVDANGNNIVGDAANEPTIAIDPTNGSRIVIGWRQFNSIQSDFRQAGWAYSHNGGQTWMFPGVLEQNVFRSDPVLAADASGNFYFYSLRNTNPYTCQMFKSTDSGVSWIGPISAYGGDKAWMTIDRTGGIGHGNIYGAWDYAGCCGNNWFTRSTDGGMTYMPPIPIPTQPYWGTVALGPNGEVYVAGGANGANNFHFVRSSNAEDPAATPTFDLVTQVDLGGSLIFSLGHGPNPGGLLGQVWLVCDTSGGPAQGNLYMLCTVDPPGSDPQDVMFARSTDGGQTWSPAVRLNDDPPGSDYWQWFGTLSVAPNGRLDVVWNDTRNGADYRWSQVFYSYSTDGGVTWAPNEPITPSFNSELGWPMQNKLGDYYHMISDNVGASLAYAATFNGEQDIYYVRIVRCADAGTIALDRAEYNCTSTATLTVNDCGLNTDDNLVEMVQVTIASNSEPSGETVVLTETMPGSATFRGAIDLRSTNAPGVLWVTTGDTVTATYVDADDGQGHQNVVVTATAAVDCVPPTISDVQVTGVQATRATVSFTTDEPARGTVRYGLDCGDLTQTVSATAYGTTTTLNLSGLQKDTTYYFMVEAEDQAGNTGTDPNCYSFYTPDAPDFFTEQFQGNNDLAYRSLRFAPGDVVAYGGCTAPLTLLPSDPAGGTPLELADNGFLAVTLSDTSVWLYGVNYNTFYVGSNGYITFTAGDSDATESLADHFDLPRVSALFDDLDPASGGVVNWKQLADRVAVTWWHVPEYGTANSNTFQIELFFDGWIAIHYLEIAATDGLAGLSAGQGLSPDYTPTDLSAMEACGRRRPTVNSVKVTTEINAPVTITLPADDDGLPDPPGALTYIITSLPAHGDLADPQDAWITSVPHALVNGGNAVFYNPDINYYGGPDSFQFKANDGTVPPEEGDSETAPVWITVGLFQLISSFPLDLNPGWSTQGQWAFGQPTGQGSHNHDPASGHTGQNVYGYNLSGDYTNNMPVYYLTTSAFDCSNVAVPELRFWRWLGVQAATADHACVQVSHDGVTWVDVWAHSGNSINDAAWSQRVFDISAVADYQPSVYLRWGMGPTNSSTTYPGWNIDDIEIWGVVPHNLIGDLNCDNAVNPFDIDPFVLALVDPQAYAATFPNCDINRADVNRDGQIDAFDIDPFVELLTR